MTLLRLCLSIPSEFRPKIVLVVLVSLGAAATQGLSVGLLVPVLQFVQDDTLPTGGVWDALTDILGVSISLPSLLISVMVMISLSQVLAYIQRSMSIRLRERYKAVLRGEAFASFVGADMNYLRSTPRGDLLNILTMEADQAADFLDSVVEFIGRLAMTGVYVGLLVLISWQISLAAMGLVLVGTMLVQYQIRRAARLGKILVDLRNEFSNFVVERLEGARLLKLHSTEEKERAGFQVVADDLSKFVHRRITSLAQIRLIMNPTIVGGGLLVLYLGVVVFDVSLVKLAVFLYVLMRLAPEALGLNSLWHGMASSKASLESVRRIISESTQRTTVVNGNLGFRGLQHGITLKNVSYAYDRCQPVLQDVSLTIPTNKITAIIGPSGVGKSTLLDLIVRLIDPDEGQLLLDGVDIREFDLATFRRHIGMVTQDIMLFSDTIMANLSYGRPDVTEAQVWDAARKANVHEFVQALPEGYDTRLGYRGMTLSGGERQRLSLARALVGDPSIILLDEVTNNLDAESSRLILESICNAAKDKTLVVSTHDFALIEMSHKVIVLENGRVLEEGTPRELAANGGLFQHYYEYVESATS